MIKKCFLGANTPEGFRSAYDTLERDPQIRRLLILKGGPGCGKSTLMKAVAQAAEGLGLGVRRIFCSSDPDSLDGIAVPELGFAIADGTAPHVMEPALCGCGANYINLGRYVCEEKVAPLAAGIRAEKAANRFCYGPAYACLAGCAAAGEAMRAIAAEAVADMTKEALRQLEREKLPKGGAKDASLRVFLTALTPEGFRSFEPDCGNVWAIRDSHRLAAPLLRKLAEAYRRAGQQTVLVLDPLDPDELEGLVIPGLDTAYLRTDPLFDLGAWALRQLNFDALAEAGIPAAHLARMAELGRLRRQLAEEAVDWLRQAKRHHDALEALYRPAVDFDGVAEETARIVDGLMTEA